MILVATGETGVDGADVIAGNEFDVVANQNGSTHTYTAANKINGLLGYASTGVNSGGGGHIGWTTSIPASLTEAWSRMYMKVPAIYTGAMCQMEYTGLTAVKLSMSAVGKLRVIDGSAATLGTSTNSLPINADFRIEFHVIGSASPTGGTIEVRIYHSKDSTTPTETMGPYTGCQTATYIDELAIGPHASGLTATLYHDDDAFSTEGWLGPATTIPISWVKYP